MRPVDRRDIQGWVKDHPKSGLTIHCAHCGEDRAIDSLAGVHIIYRSTGMEIPTILLGNLTSGAFDLLCDRCMEARRIVRA